MGLIAMVSYLATVVVNCCLMLAPDKEDLIIWLSITHGMIGVGGLTSPLLVNLLQLDIYFKLGFLSLFLAPFFLYFTTPEDLNKEQGVEVPEKADEHNPEVNSENPEFFRLEVMMSIGFFLVVGTESNVGGWISSYATLSGIADKEGAAIFATIFWAFFTLFRFVFPLIKSKDSSKLKGSLDFCLIALIICIILALLK